MFALFRRKSHVPFIPKEMQAYSEEMQARAAVMHGAALLDAAQPGWENRINLENLCLSSTDRCILGQLYGNYNTGARTLGVDDVVNYGFFAKTDISYRALDEAWTELVRNRLALAS